MEGVVSTFVTACYPETSGESNLLQTRVKPADRSTRTWRDRVAVAPAVNPAARLEHALLVSEHWELDRHQRGAFDGSLAPEMLNRPVVAVIKE
jgi:hypothetical protein